MHSTKAEVDFTLHLGAQHDPTHSTYWKSGLLGLIRGSRAPWWTVRVGSPVDPVSREVLDAFGKYGWPAIQAALDEPGYPPDPSAYWLRRFPPRPADDHLVWPPDLGELAWATKRTGRPADRWFANLADDNEVGRMFAVDEIGLRALTDPRAVPVLLDRLARTPAH